jgi:hypothetical protein
MASSTPLEGVDLAGASGRGKRNEKADFKCQPKQRGILKAEFWIAQEGEDQKNIPLGD